MKSEKIKQNQAFFSHRMHVIGAAATVALALVACGDDKKATDASEKPKTAQTAATTESKVKAALSVTTTTPQMQQLSQVITANGNIVAWQEASVGAEVNGLRVASVLVSVGDVVKKGQVLASFVGDTTQADLLQVQANYEAAKADADRARSIQDTGALSKQQLDQYFTLEKVAAAQLKAAQVRSNNTTLRAPDAGVISMRNATVGAVVGAGQEMFRLIRQGRLEWQAQVTSAEIAKIKVGQVATLTTDGGLEVSGKVRAIAPSADPQTRNIVIFVDLPAQAGLKAGTFAKGHFQLGQSQALTVPAESLVIRDGFDYVFVLDANNKAQQRKVQIGRRSGNQVEILEGLNASDKIVLKGAGFVNQGDTVKVVN